MNSPKFLLTLAAMLLVVLVQAQRPASSAKENTYALVVGISTYQNPSIPSLQFADKDALEFAGFLQSGVGGNVPPDNISLLLNEQATFTAIYDAMYQLLEIAEKNDRVFFYFSGHGDVENITVFNLGYLLGYNTPPNNYINHAVRIEDVNNFANTLSSKKVKVFLITDACRSGKLAGDGIDGRRLVGEQLRSVQNNEVRMASCGPDELSAENEGWGGGRGVFSYYLLQGLKGMAAKSGDSGVNVADVKTYLTSSFATDAILLRENHQQSPIIEGNTSLMLSTPNSEDIAAIRAIHHSDKSMPAGLQRFLSKKAVPLQPLEFVVAKLKEFDIFEGFDFQQAREESIELFPFSVLSALEQRLFSTEDIEIINRFIANLHGNPADIRRLKERLAGVIQDKGHEKIAAYLLADRAELEKRSYFNIKNGEYDKYVDMYSFALLLIPPDHFLYRSLQVDKNYFQGVLWRMKTRILGEDVELLLGNAFQALQSANQIEPYAPYVHNELGNVYLEKGKLDSAIFHYQTATELAPTWAVPWSNLTGVYNRKGDLDAARFAAGKARLLQPELFNLLMNEGVTEELSKNWLRAEELYLKGLKQNTLHFFPYESLGRVYAVTMKFAEADLNFFEAEKRKFGFQNMVLDDLTTSTFVLDASASHVLEPECQFYAPGENETNALYLCIAAYYNASIGNDSLAEHFYARASKNGDSSFLINHHFGKWLYNKERLIESEPFLKKARLQYKDEAAFQDLVNSLQEIRIEGISEFCFLYYLKRLHYNWLEDDYILADVYERLEYIQEAEQVYENLIAKDTSDTFSGAYYLLAEMLIKKGKYEAAERTWLRYKTAIEQVLLGKRELGYPYGEILSLGRGSFELDDFYSDMLLRFPKTAAWFMKAGRLWYHKIMRDPGYYIVSDSDNRFTGITQKSQTLSILMSAVEPLPGIDRYISFKRPLDFLFEKTIETLKVAADLATDDEYFVEACSMLAELYLADNEPFFASEWYAKALEVVPDNSSIRLRLANCLQQADLQMDAYLQLNTLHTNGKLLSSDFLKYADMAMRAANYSGARDVLQKCQLLLPESPHLVTALFAKLYFIKQDLENALPIFQKEIYGMSDAEKYYALASIHAATNHTEEAISWLQKALDHQFPYGYLLRYDPVWKNWHQQENWNNLVEKHAAQFVKYE